MTQLELQEAWIVYRPRVADDYGDWDRRRIAAIPEYERALSAFIEGASDVDAFRTQIDRLGKSNPLFGFGGMSQMFFNQLVNAAEPKSLDAALKDALPAPVDEADAQAKLERFCAAVEDSRENAQALGVTQPGVGRVDTFVSFFWELQDRERWPRFFPNSRDLLDQHGLLETNQPQPELYLAYRSALSELKDLLGIDTWTLEHLLWHLGEGADEKVADTKPEVISNGPADGSSTDIYESYKGQHLYFPDEVITSLVLSMATKRLVILSGISGTGKTQIALGLARFLEQNGGHESTEVEAPRQDSRNLYIRLTAPYINNGYVNLGKEARERLDETLGLPPRGSSRLYETRLPGGVVLGTRLNNVGFENEARELYRLYLRKHVAAWVRANGKPGDFLHLALGSEDGAEISLDVVAGTRPAPDEQTERHATIAVRSDWTDPRGLVGYFNPLTGSYVRTYLVELLLRAGEDPDNPYVAILDEMNLARVEYYFSDFLSALESGEPLRLMAPGEADESAAAGEEDSEVPLPAALEIPSNVSFIGTVNVDETTHPFSPKVLDRANVLEFNEVDVERALGHGDGSQGRGLRLKDGAVDSEWFCTDKDAALGPRARAHGVETFTGALEDVHGILALHNLQFGYRVIDEVSAFVGHALEKAEGDAEEVTRLALDLQLRQKIVPKLSGGRELEEPLARLLHYCLDGERHAAVDVEAARAAARARLDPATTGGGPMFPGAARKLLRMLDRLADAGFVGALE